MLGIYRLSGDLMKGFFDIRWMGKRMKVRIGILFELQKKECK